MNHSVKSKANKVKYKLSTSDVSSDFSDALCQDTKYKISKVKSDSKFRKKQEWKTRKNKTNKIMFSFFSKKNTIVNDKLKTKLTNTINGYFQTKFNEKCELASEMNDEMKFKQSVGNCNNKNNKMHPVNELLNIKTYNSNSKISVDSEIEEGKLEKLCKPKSVLLESTNCNYDKFSSLKVGSKSCRHALKLNMCSKNKNMKIRKKSVQNESGQGKEASKENFSDLKLPTCEVRSKRRVDKKHVISKPSFKIKLIDKGNLSNKHKKVVSKLQTNDRKCKVSASKQDDELLQGDEDFTEDETTSERKFIEKKCSAESKAIRCLCSYFKVKCTHCSGNKIVIKDEFEVAKKQVKEKLSFTESIDSSQLKLSLSSNGFCLTRAENT